jgi:hypothetical protein
MKKTLPGQIVAFGLGVLLTASGFHFLTPTPHPPQVIVESRPGITGGSPQKADHESGPGLGSANQAPTDPSVGQKLLYGKTSNDLADWLLLDAWAKTDPAGLRQWLLAMPEHIIKRKKLSFLGMLALADHHAGSLKDLLGERAAFYTELSVPQQVEVLARLSKEQTQDLENSKSPTAPKLEERLLQRAEILRKVNSDGFEAALTAFNQSKQTGEIVANQAMELFKNLPDSSPAYLARIYGQLSTTDWWGNDHDATYAATLELARCNPELATRETLKLPGIVGDTASQEAYRLWSRKDPEAALHFLPHSGIVDKSRQINFLMALESTSKDPGILAEVKSLISELKR